MISSTLAKNFTIISCLGYYLIFMCSLDWASTQPLLIGERNPTVIALTSVNHLDTPIMRRAERSVVIQI